MSLKLVAPGKRPKRIRGKLYPNRFFLVIGRFAGRDWEVSTKTIHKSIAERFKNDFEKRILDGCIPGPQADIGFHKAADLYAAGKNLSKPDQARVKRLKGQIADKPVRSVVQADFDSVAQICHPGKPATQNRNIYTPGAAILHYAAENEWCEWRRIRRPKAPGADTRAAASHVAPLLIEGTEGKERLLIAWLFKHGTRISGALSVRCERIDLKARTYDFYISKNRQWKTFALDDEVWELLVAQQMPNAGPLFPWSNRWAVYRWLRPLRERLAVTFTPHMARHKLGKDLNAAGAGLKTIMGALGQLDPKSASRYAAEDVETVRAATRAIGRKLG